MPKILIEHGMAVLEWPPLILVALPFDDIHVSNGDFNLHHTIEHLRPELLNANFAWYATTGVQ